MNSSVDDMCFFQNRIVRPLSTRKSMELQELICMQKPDLDVGEREGGMISVKVNQYRRSWVSCLPSFPWWAGERMMRQRSVW